MQSLGLFWFHARDALVKSPADILTVEDINRRCSTVVTDAIARKWFSTANKNAGKLWLSLPQFCQAGDECFHAHARYHSLIEQSQKQQGPGNFSLEVKQYLVSWAEKTEGSEKANPRSFTGFFLVGCWD